MNTFDQIKESVRTHGAAYSVSRTFRRYAATRFGTENSVWRRGKASENELAAQRASQPKAGLISVLVTVFNTRPRFLLELLDSLVSQTYSDWEAILLDGNSTDPGTLDVLSQAAARDPRFRVIHSPVNNGISGNTNLAAAQAAGSYITPVDHDDVLSPDALWRMADAIVRLDPDVLYSDEDLLTENSRFHFDLHRKPDLLPDSLNAENYICHLLTVRKSLFLQIGGMRSAFDGSQDHDLVLRLSEYTKNFVHLPYTLYSWRRVGDSVSHSDLSKCLDAGCRAVTEHEARNGRTVTVTADGKVLRLSYAVPDNPKTDLFFYGGTAECREAEKALPRLQNSGRLNIHIISTTCEYLFRDINKAVENSEADYILLADACARVRDRGFLNELLMYAQRDDIAAVTPVLVSRTRTVTHAGYVLDGSLAVRCIEEGRYARSGSGYNILLHSRNVSAVSIGCLMFRRDHFIPFDERFHTGLGAVDWCLSQRALKRLFVYTPHAEAYCVDPRLLLNGKKRDRSDINMLFKKHSPFPVDN